MRLLLILTSLLLVGMSAIPKETTTIVRQGKDYAIFFAVDDYTSSPSFDDLKNPIRDAEAIASELRDMYGFEATVYKNQSKDQIYEVLQQWQNRNFQPGDQLFVFFSGHGDFIDFKTKGYFIANGSLGDNDAAYIDLSTLRNIVTKIPCEHILLAIDACYSGTIDEALAFKSGSWTRPKFNSETERDQLVNKLLRNKTRLVVTSGGKERTPDGTNHSPFASAFLKGLRAAYGHGDGVFTYKDLVASLERVSPSPYIGNMIGHEEGSFVFAREAVPVIAQSTTTSPRCQYCPEMVSVAGGTFQMGDVMEDNERSDEQIHSVTLDHFYMSSYEISNTEFSAFLNENGNQIEGGVEWLEISSSLCEIEKSGNTYRPKSSMGNHPVVEVSWYGAIAYAEWLSEKTGKNFRLPTEAEWEYAAREGGKKIRFGNGKNIADPSQMNFDASPDYKKSYSVEGEYKAKTVAVDSFSPNSLGLYNMSGNVWEWCSDWYDSEYYGKSPSENPKGAHFGSYRVSRGGSWNYNAEGCRVAYRISRLPGRRSNFLGFRLAHSS